MILQSYALLDTKTGSYGTPFFTVHQQVAMRMVIDVARDLNTMIGRHPADYALVRLGDFDDQTGVFAQANPTVVGLVVGLLPQTEAAPELFSSRPGADGAAERI